MSPWPGPLERVVAGWWDWVVPLSTQALVLLALALLVERGFARRLHPRSLLLLWGLLCLRLALPPAAGEAVAREALLPTLERRLAAAPPYAADAALPRFAFASWLAGLAVVGGLTLARVRRLRRELGGTRDADTEARLRPLVARACRALGLRRDVRVEVRAAAPGPLVAGLLRPRVVLPSRFVADEAEPALEAALLHELAHVARRDPLRGALVLSVQALLWFHPAAWLVGRRLRVLAEAGADARAARAIAGGRARYRRLLAGLARRSLFGRAPTHFPGLALAGHPHELGARLAWLEPARPRARPRALGETLALAGFLLACLPLAAPPPAWDQRLTALLGSEPPPLGSLQGCLQRRVLLFGLLGDAVVPDPAAAAAPSPVTPSVDPTETTSPTPR